MEKAGVRSAGSNVGLLLLLVAGCQDADSPALGVEAGLTGDAAPTGLVDATSLNAEGGLVVDASGVGVYDAYVLPLSDASAGSEAAAPSCQSSAGSDSDSDGFAAPIDCNDCDPSINPAAFDVLKNGIDDDCSGGVDDEPMNCDAQLGENSDDALVAARALGLCRRQTGSSWGLLEAKWVFPDGTATSVKYVDCPAGRPPHPQSRSIRANYGSRNLPREGQRMLVLSSGIARPGNETLGPEWLPAKGQSPSVTMCTASKPPAGFPKVPTACMNGVPNEFMNDGIALELKLKVPSNALTFDYDFFFLSSEFPDYVCAGYNDHFVALLKSKSPGTPADGNISYDAAGNVVSIDTAFLEVCTPLEYLDRTFACKRGASAIEDLGFALQPQPSGSSYLKGAATDWLHTRAAIVPGETITIRFAIWDTQDSLGDSTVLLDNVSWTFMQRTANPPPPPKKPETTWIELL